MSGAGRGSDRIIGWAASVARRAAAAFLVFVALSILPACSTARPPLPRPFDFNRDTFSFRNDLLWEYRFDSEGRWTSRPREPRPDYTHHCFVVVRAARQFFYHARFDPSSPKVPEEEYRRLIVEVTGRDARGASTEAERVSIPGYPDLRSFSRDHETLLKQECGGAWESYFQRGHWRIVLPFPRWGQADTAKELMEAVDQNDPAIIHVVRFPDLEINHALLVHSYRKTEKTIDFSVYDPNFPERPSELWFDHHSQSFFFPANDYYRGGPLDVYEIYRGWFY